jgi:phage gp45-like
MPHPILRGLVTGVTLGTRRMMLQLGIRAGEVAGAVEGFLPYGMSACPVPSKTLDAVSLPIGDTRDHQICFADDWSLRIADLMPGEFGGRDQHGRQIVFRQDKFEITAPTGNLEITLSGGNIVIAVTGDVTLTASGDVTLGATGKMELTAAPGQIKANGNVLG